MAPRALMYIRVWIVCLLAGCISLLNSKDAPDTFSASIESLRKKLSTAQAEFSGSQSLAHGQAAIEAHARLDATESGLSENPKDEKAPAMLRACSLMVEAAIIQMAIAEYKATLVALRDSIIAAGNDINDIHEAINRIERSKASQLKENLDAEKQRAEKLRAESEKLRAEAERRFNELQSELISVKQDARGTIISMSDILFDVNKAALTTDLKTNLAKIAGILTIFKNSRIIVEGHTDNQGTADYNQKLSQKRAKNVMNFLIKQGVSQTRLTAIGYGLTQPVADNSTAEGRQKNRRVDLVIQEKKQAQEKEEE